VAVSNNWIKPVAVAFNLITLIVRSLDMETRKTDERYISVRIVRSLPLAEQLHEANALLCNEASEDENVFLENLDFRNGHIVLLYRLGNGGSDTKVVKSRK
jgi:hypothetical protein